MIYSREDHAKFLKQELRAQTDVYTQKLDTSAIFLLQDREQLFVAQFLKFQNGEMILKFPNSRGLPRIGERLYCFSVPKDLRNYRSWGKRTYGDLIKAKSNYSEVTCIWQTPTNEKDFSLVGFRNIDLEFALYIEEAEGMILLLGPNKPPFEYIANLQSIVKYTNNESLNKILDRDYHISKWEPSLLDNRVNTANFILNQLTLVDTLIIQGPPGTGKTFLIAEICEKLCNQDKSVLVTALTNRALIEIIEKPALEGLLKDHRIFKTNLSFDEARSNKDLQRTKEVSPRRGTLILSTYFIASGQAAQTNNNPPFDYVIMDEASQALLGMFGGALLLGKKNIWIGDVKQLPPVVALSEDKVIQKNYSVLVDGLKSLSETDSFPIYQLTETYRLTKRAAKYSGIFYNDRLVSKAKDIQLSYPEINSDFGQLFNPEGGPTLIKMDLKVGYYKPQNALKYISELVHHLLKADEKLHISILTYFVETTKALQKTIFHQVDQQNRLLIETVSRVQGLTTDIAIFFIPNSSYHRSLESRLFNVATSRSKRHSLIITDKNILLHSQIDNNVKTYLQRLNEDFSFFIQANNTALKGSKGDKKEKDKIGNISADENPKPIENESQNNLGLTVLGKIDLSKFNTLNKDSKNPYIIDTNVFVDEPEIISKINLKHSIYLSAKVIDELDRLKIKLNQTGKIKVQKALKSINKHMDRTNVSMIFADESLLPKDFDNRSLDNMILSVALKHKDQDPILITSDNGLQAKAKGFSIKTKTLNSFLKELKRK